MSEKKVTEGKKRKNTERKARKRVPLFLHLNELLS